MQKVAKLVREQIDSLPTRAFVRVADVRTQFRPANDAAIEQAFCRIAKAGHITRIGKGVYWKAPVSRFGPVPPSRFEAALAVAADRAPGPSGPSAAAFLGLTTQIPPVQEFAVIGRESTKLPGTIFRERANPKRDGLNPAEIAVLEVARDQFRYCETPRNEAILRIRNLVKHGKIDMNRVSTAAQGEMRNVQEFVESLR